MKQTLAGALALLLLTTCSSLSLVHGVAIRRAANKLVLDGPATGVVDMTSTDANTGGELFFQGPKWDAAAGAFTGPEDLVNVRTRQVFCGSLKAQDGPFVQGTPNGPTVCRIPGPFGPVGRATLFLTWREMPGGSIYNSEDQANGAAPETVNNFHSSVLNFAVHEQGGVLQVSSIGAADQTPWSDKGYRLVTSTAFPSDLRYRAFWFSLDTATMDIAITIDQSQPPCAAFPSSPCADTVIVYNLHVRAHMEMAPATELADPLNNDCRGPGATGEPCPGFP